MTVVSIEQFRKDLDLYLAKTGEMDVILTRDGKPCFRLLAIGGNGANPENPEYDPEFWSMIQKRRQEKGIPWDEAKKQLDLD